MVKSHKTVKYQMLTLLSVLRFTQEGDYSRAW